MPADPASDRLPGVEGTTLRPIRPEDEPFLREVYAGTRAEEMALVNWDESQKRAFVNMQFDAQHRYYTDQFRGAEFLIVEQDGRPIGRLYLDRPEEEIRIIDIALLPEKRNSGIGTALIREVLREGAEAAKPVRIHVEQFNPARRLYNRLGFTEIGTNGVYFLMEWRPGAALAATE
ncbi:MAG: GNAT family N-acetyltransferase [Bryobacteraceae bacterium]